MSTLDLATPPDRAVEWVCWQPLSKGEPIKVMAQSHYEARRQAAIRFKCGPDEIVAVLA